MNRQIIAAGISGIIIGVIIGFFSAKAMLEPASALTDSSSEQLPENHPGIEVMERIHTLTQQAEVEPDNLEIRISLGNTFYDMGRYDVSARWYREALELDPNQLLVSTDLGTSLLFMGQTEEAIAQYRHSLSLDPAHPQTLQNLGVAFFSMERFQDAIDVWQRLLEESPEYAEAGSIKEQIAAAEEKIREREGVEQ